MSEKLVGPGDRPDLSPSTLASNDPTDVLVIGAGAAGPAVAWMLARAGIGVVCLKQGDWVDPHAFPHWRVDWELHRNTDWSPEPNVRRLPQDYPVNDAGSPISPLMYNAVGGSTVHWSAHFPLSFAKTPSGGQVVDRSALIMPRSNRGAVGLHVSMVSIQETIPQSSAGAVSVYGHLPGGREGAVGTAGPVGLAWSRTLQGSGHCERLPEKLGAVPPAVTVPPAVDTLRADGAGLGSREAVTQGERCPPAPHGTRPRRGFISTTLYRPRPARRSQRR
jgi:hypothetical protein